MPPPDPPIVNEGRIIVGKPMFFWIFTASSIECATAASGTPSPISPHRDPELLAVFGHVDRVSRRADHFHPELFQHPLAGQVQGAVQRRLSAHGRQQGVGALLGDHIAHHIPADRLDVHRIGDFGIGHDGRRIGVDQDHPVALLPQRLDRLHAGIVEFAGLADHDRPGSDNQDGLDVSSFRHSSLHHLREFGEQPAQVVRSGTGFGMALKTEGQGVGQGNALQTAVKQRAVGSPDPGRQ